MFEYQLKKIKDTITSGFPIASINKVKAKLENKRINYLIIDRRSGYTIDSLIDNIYVYEDKKIKIKFKYEDEYNYLMDFIKRRKNFLS